MSDHIFYESSNGLILNTKHELGRRFRALFLVHFEIGQIEPKLGPKIGHYEGGFDKEWQPFSPIEKDAQMSINFEKIANREF